MNRLAKNTLIYTIGNILPQAAGFLLLPVYTAYLSPEDYGIVSSMQVLSSILQILFTLGIERSIYRLYFDYRSDLEIRDYLGTITISLFVISSFALALTFIFRNVIGRVYKSIDFYPFYLYSILGMYFSIFSIIPKIYLQLKEKAGNFVILSILQFVLNTCLVLWFIIKKKAGAAGMLSGGMYANIFMLPIFIYYSNRIMNLKFKWTILANSLSFSIPMIPSLLSAWVLNLSNRIFIERYFSLHDVGIFSLGSKIVQLILVFSSAFSQAFNPVFYRLANSNDQMSSKKKLSQYCTLYVLVLLFISFLVSFFSKEVIVLFLNKNYGDAYKIVPILTLGYFFSQASGLFNLMVYQEKKASLITIVILISAAINILINYILIPRYGSYGAAFATFFSFLMMFLFSYLVATKCYFIQLNWRMIILCLLISIIITIIFNYINLPTIYILISKIVLILGVILYIYKFKLNKIRILIRTI